MIENSVHTSRGIKRENLKNPRVSGGAEISPEQAINCQISADKKYFNNILIGVQNVKSPSIGRKFVAPYIALFIDKDSREQFLESTKESENPNIIKLRTILSNDNLRVRNLMHMVEVIGDICEKNKFAPYFYTIITYTERALNGRRIKIGIDYRGNR